MRRPAGAAAVLVGFGSVRTGQIALTLALGAATVGIIVDPSLAVSVPAPTLDVVVGSVAAIVSLTAALLGVLRWREASDTPALLDAAALLLLAVANAVHVVLVVTALDGLAGIDAASPRAAPLLVWAIDRDIALGLLLVSCLPAARRWRPSRRSAAAVLVAPTIGVLAVTAGLVLLEQHQPLLDPAALAEIAAPTTHRPALLGGPLFVLNLVGVAVIAMAAVVRPAQRGGALPPTWLAAALTIGAFAQLHVVLLPSSFGGALTTADVLQVAFYLTLYAALQSTRVRDFRLAREALDRGRRLRRSDLVEVAIAERLHVAREIHDTVVQELIALRRACGAGHAGAPHGTGAESCQRAQVAADAALVAARRLIDELRSGYRPGGVVSELLPKRLREVAEEDGYAVDLRTDPVLDLVAGPRGIEVMRIVDEALANIRRHADATTVRVWAARAASELILTITDNGHGFATERATGGHGLRGMRERAALLGGRLAVTSAPGEGTQVRLIVPLQDGDEH